MFGKKNRLAMAPTNIDKNSLFQKLKKYKSLFQTLDIFLARWESNLSKSLQLPILGEKGRKKCVIKDGGKVGPSH